MLYNNLIEAYEKNGIPLTKVLDCLKVSETTYLDWVKRGNIPASALIKLSENLNCSVDFLLNIHGGD